MMAGYKVHMEKPQGCVSDEMPKMMKSAIQAGGLTKAPLKNRIRATLIRLWRNAKWRL